jgi:hypothetical protein
MLNVSEGTPVTDILVLHLLKQVVTKPSPASGASSLNVRTTLAVPLGDLVSRKKLPVHCIASTMFPTIPTNMIAIHPQMAKTISQSLSSG